MYKITIPLVKLAAGMTLADPVQITNQHGENILVLPRSYVVTDKAILALKRLANFKTGTIAIYSSAPTSPSETAEVPGPLVIEQDAESHAEITVISEKMRDVAVDGIRTLFSSITPSSKEGNMTTAFHLIKNLDNILDEIVETVTSNPKGLVQIAGLRSYDEYTYHHSLSVAVLCIAIGQAMSFDRDRIMRLSRSAMLHDIGKMMVPHILIAKPGILSKDEFAKVKSHPVLGARFLKDENVGDKELWDSVEFHHEKADGSGYPSGLKLADTPLFSRIIAVADVYDALTSFRPYRQPMNPPANAVELLMSEAGATFDLDVVQAFMKRIELYPIGSTVQLSDKRYGRVVNNKHPMRPMVRMLENDDIVDLGAIANLHLVIIWAE